jgi:hypothetical protein
MLEVKKPLTLQAQPFGAREDRTQVAAEAQAGPAAKLRHSPPEDLHATFWPQFRRARADAAWCSCEGRPNRAVLYVVLTRLDRITNGFLTGPCGRLNEIVLGRPAMLDLIYLALGLAGFAAFALGVRAAGRM